MELHKKFHERHGKNIVMDDSYTLATRTSSFADAIVFSSNPLSPNESFIVQILHTERGWSGHVRVGLTQINPATIVTLPQFAMPDFVQKGNTWICALSKNHSSTVPYSNDPLRLQRQEMDSLLPRLMSLREQPQNILSTSTYDDSASVEAAIPTEVGSYLGVRFVPKDQHYAEMRISVNGRDWGQCADDIPYHRGPIYAVIDVYGTTKAIRAVQSVYFPSLQDICRQAILRSIRSTAVSALPLPKPLKEYLLSSDNM